jgi:hypothetical protein
LSGKSGVRPAFFIHFQDMNGTLGMNRPMLGTKENDHETAVG